MIVPDEKEIKMFNRRGNQRRGNGGPSTTEILGSLLRSTEDRERNNQSNVVVAEKI